HDAELAERVVAGRLDHDLGTVEVIGRTLTRPAHEPWHSRSASLDAGHPQSSLSACGGVAGCGHGRLRARPAAARPAAGRRPERGGGPAVPAGGAAAG